MNFAVDSGVVSDGRQLVVELLGDGYVNPNASPPDATTRLTASISTQTGMRISTVSADSGVFNDNRDMTGVSVPVPPTFGLDGGITGVASAMGGLTGNASFFLMPNPSTSLPYPISNPFSFYQAFYFTGFTATGSGTFQGNTAIDAVPEPATVLSALFGVPALGYWVRRRRVAKELAA